MSPRKTRITDPYRHLPAYRLYAPGSHISSVGTWMQRIAQDWLVLETSHGSGTALGIVTALQFLPVLLLGPLGGSLADRLPRRTALMAVNAAQATAAAGLAALALTGNLTLGLIYVSAVLGGVLGAFDGPLRSAFLHDLAGHRHITGVVSLEAASGNLARLIGPAVAGVLIATLGAGWAVAANAASFLVVIAALAALGNRVPERARETTATGSWAQALTVLRSRGDLVVVLALAFFAGTFGFNFGIINALMTTDVFGRDASSYGALASIIGIGALAGTLLAARRRVTRIRLVAASTAAFGATIVAASTMPTYASYATALAVVGAASMTVVTSANSYLQLTVPDAVRGRIMAVYMMVFAGGTPIGAPLIGFIAEHAGPRVALATGGAITTLGALVAVAAFLAVADLTVRLRRAHATGVQFVVVPRITA